MPRIEKKICTFALASDCQVTIRGGCGENLRRLYQAKDGVLFDIKDKQIYEERFTVAQNEVVFNYTNTLPDIARMLMNNIVMNNIQITCKQRRKNTRVIIHNKWRYLIIPRSVARIGELQAWQRKEFVRRLSMKICKSKIATSYTMFINPVMTADGELCVTVPRKADRRYVNAVLAKTVRDILGE